MQHTFCRNRCQDKPIGRIRACTVGDFVQIKVDFGIKERNTASTVFLRCSFSRHDAEGIIDSRAHEASSPEECHFQKTRLICANGGVICCAAEWRVRRTRHCSLNGVCHGLPPTGIGRQRVRPKSQLGYETVRISEILPSVKLELENNERILGVQKDPARATSKMTAVSESVGRS